MRTLPALTLAAAGLLALTACSAEPVKTAAAPITPTTHKVTYQVHGTNPSKTGVGPYGLVTLRTPSGTKQVSSTWPIQNKADGTGLTYTMAGGDIAYMSAQAKHERATVICEIWVDGVLKATNTSNGSYAAVTCEATV